MTITPAAEWLLDNYYVVEEAIQEVRRDFPRRFYRQLPTMKIGEVEIPRTLALGWLYVAHTQSSVSRESLTAIVEGFQKVEAFKIGELWALPSIVRFILIENLRRISSRVERSRGMRRKANEVADELIRQNDPEKSVVILREIEHLVADNTFVAQLLYRLRDGLQASGAAIQWLEKQIEARGTDLEEVLVAEQNRLSSGNVTMSNLIKGLRSIDDTEWPVWVESVSRLDAALREGSDYTELDFGSRNSYRDTIEKLARRSGHSEYEVTQIAIEMVREAEAAAATEAPLQEPNVGSFLVGKQLLEELHGYVVAVLLADLARLLVGGAGVVLASEVALKHFLDVLADVQGVEHLHVRKAVEEDDAVDQLVGVLHLLDGFRAPFLGEILEAPVVEQPVVQPVLVDRGQFVAERLVQEIDDFWIALHGATPVLSLGACWPAASCSPS